MKYQAAEYGCVVVGVTEEDKAHLLEVWTHSHKLGGFKRFICPDCGHAIGRDLNGAFNLKVEGFERYLHIWNGFIPDSAIPRNFRQLPDFSGLNVSEISAKIKLSQFKISRDRQ